MDIDGLPFDLWLEKVSYELCKEEYEAIIRKRNRWMNPPNIDAAEIGFWLFALLASPFIALYALTTGELP